MDTNKHECELGFTEENEGNEDRRPEKGAKALYRRERRNGEGDEWQKDGWQKDEQKNVLILLLC